MERAEGEAVLEKIVIGDEMWVYYYDPENKKQPMEYHQRVIIAGKVQNETFNRKIVLTVFWNSEGVILAQFLVKGTIVMNHSEPDDALKR